MHIEAFQGTDDGKRAVGWAILNRQNNPERFSSSICGVITQPGQFPWHISTRVKHKEDYERSLSLAYQLLDSHDSMDITHGAQFFASGLDDWFRSMIRQGKLIETANIGGHRFYRLNE